MFKEYPHEAYKFTDENGDTYYSTPQQDLLVPLILLLGIVTILPIGLMLTLQIYLGR